MIEDPKIEARPRKWLTPVALVHGYEIMERLEEEFGFEQINPGSVYRSLRQMEKEGLCESEWEPAKSGPARRMYYITKAGEDFLVAWADASKQYQQVADSFYRVYSSRISRTSE